MRVEEIASQLVQRSCCTIIIFLPLVSDMKIITAGIIISINDKTCSYPIK